jgi:hypothetical protein
MILDDYVDIGDILRMGMGGSWFFFGMGCCEYGDDGPQKPTNINHCCTEYVWVSYNIPLTWIKAIKGDGFLY